MNTEWKTVPATMTLDMCVAFAEAWFSKVRCIDDPEMQDAYAAMLAAAPPAPTSHPIPTGATGEVQDGLAEAQRLAQALFQRHFSQDDDYVSGRVKWEVLDDLPGVLSQIDNMVSGLVQPAAPAAGDALDAQALEDLQRLLEYAQTSDDCQYGTLSTGLVRDLTAKALATLAAAGDALKFLADTEGAIESLMLEGRNTLYRVWWPAVGELQTEWFASPQEAVEAAIAQQSQRKEA